MDGDAAYVYIDVRSVPEFNQGHPQGAHNIPLMNFDVVKQEMSRNKDFERVVRATFKPDQRIILGCKSGGRSVRAGSILDALGYANLCNMVGGFAGGEDENGEPVPGWADRNLPVGRMALSRRSYDILLDAAPDE